MKMVDKKESSFDGSINISSNIKANKNTIIGKFDFRDLMYITVAIVVGILIISILVVLLPFTNIFIIFLILALFEIPIISIGFMNIYNMKLIDYIKMIDKSDNKPYRRQTIRRKQDKDYYIIPLVLTNEDIGSALKDIELVLVELKKYIKFENQYEIKIFNKSIILLIKIKESKFVDYAGLFRFLRENRDIKYISNDDIKIYSLYLSSLIFIDKKYNKQQLEVFSKEKLKLSRIRPRDLYNEKYYSLTNEIIDKRDNEYLKVLKIVLYKYPFNIDILNKIKEFCDITIYIDLKDEKFSVENINYIDTFILFTGSKENIDVKTKLVLEILNKANIIYKEINEENIRSSIDFIMENRY